MQAIGKRFAGACQPPHVKHAAHAAARRGAGAGSSRRVSRCQPERTGATRLRAPPCRVAAPSQGIDLRDAAGAVAAPAQAPRALAPATNARPDPVPLEQAPMGLTYFSDGSCAFRVWAPHAASAQLLVSSTVSAPRGATPNPHPEASGLDVPADDHAAGAAEAEAAAAAAAAAAAEPQGALLPLARAGDVWGAVLPAGALAPGSAYQVRLWCTQQVVLNLDDGRRLARRDPYARQTDYGSEWCFAVDQGAYEWAAREWAPPGHEHYIIYEMHVGSFTPEGTLAAAAAKLAHVASLGFTCVQLMPLAEHSDAWGYNPRQLMSLHGAYGTPDDMRAFVDAAHAAGLAVVVDVVLHHGAPEGNALWEYDGWGPDHCGGIYHEGAPDTEWGRQFAFWKREVIDMVTATCVMWLGEYRADGLRFDSANDLPGHAVQAMTWSLHEQFPGRLLTAEITPENPRGIHELGFDALWVHSGYFDIIQQHRALGRGHHGGGDWAAGWDLPKLRTAMGLHYGFESPTQCVKYMLGSHDQVGCRHGGKWYADYQAIGGQHRYAVDQFGGGRHDPHASAAARCWWAANVAAAGLPMMFMGTEAAQSGWWDTDGWHGFQWGNTEDEPGRAMMAAVAGANALRAAHPALRRGRAATLHEDRPNGVMAYERVLDGEDSPRVVVVVNAGRQYWQGGEYGVWVGGSGAMEEVYCSQSPEFGAVGGHHSNAGGPVAIHDGRMYINIPPCCTLFFVHSSL